MPAIYNDQKARLNIIEALLHRRAKILYAPNVDVVQKVIHKANESFAFIHQLNIFARLVTDFVKKSDAKSLNTTEVISQSSIEFMKWYYGTTHPLRFLIRGLYNFNRTEVIEKWNLLVEETSLNATLPSFIGVVFNNINEKDTSLGPVVTYKIRQKPDFIPTTRATHDKFTAFFGPRIWDDLYYSYGFLWLQDVIERSIISAITGITFVEPGAGIEEMAFPCFRYDRYCNRLEWTGLLFGCRGFFPYYHRLRSPIPSMLFYYSVMKPYFDPPAFL
ncbi:hypothetical protein DICVIV_06155 [Dictyocaulus viviparus]|uniref:Uncharacterized protein n=1 Tax=Dictyocaulus viviparus TaxID=29172 RepID=A0A0D8XZJ0_DICVI|nr:hypothetical protein DICVIV_06155 [Dictyocaulus viviparus]